MNQEEKIYQKIKNASNKAEEKPFPGMDKVWNRVEEKLDTKIIKKKSEVWKKLAIAASFLLFFTVGIQLYTTQKELIKPIEPHTNVEKSSEKSLDNNINEQQESSEISSEIETFATTNKPKAVTIEAASKTSKKEISTINKNDRKVSNLGHSPVEAEQVIANDVKEIDKKESAAKGHYNASSSKTKDFLRNKTIYEARSSNFKYDVVKSKKSEIEEKVVKPQTKSDDLVLINGELSSKKREDLSSSEMDEMVELKNPIYIINGEEFSEESLFGEKPTSKYAPLSAQKIDSIKVYLPEEAIPIYGEKGKNGIVIISIKN